MKTNPLIHHVLLAVASTGLSLAKAPSAPPADRNHRTDNNNLRMGNNFSVLPRARAHHTAPWHR